MRVNSFKRITFLTTALMEDEDAFFGKFQSEGSVKLAISFGAD